jgi:hypothetical protein
MTKNKMKQLKRQRVRMELTVVMLKTLNSFKSKEEPDYGKLTKNDIIYVLSSIIKRKTE